MSEVILPCAHCRTDRHLSVQSFKTLRFTLFRVICTGCLIDGPAGDTRESAIEAHNALPRALRWTHEPPKVAGWYWRRNVTAKDVYRVCRVYCCDDTYLFPSSEWAGPISPPID